LLNKEIHNFRCMKPLWGGSDVVRRCKGHASSKGGTSLMSCGSSKSSRSCKSDASTKGAATSKKWYDDDDDDFMLSKRVQVTPRHICQDQAGKEVDDNGVDDFM
jgi:hypothetical protein